MSAYSAISSRPAFVAKYAERAAGQRRIARDRPVVRASRRRRVRDRAVERVAARIHELGEPDGGDPVQEAQVGLLEGLDDHRGAAAVEAGALERLDDAPLERQPELMVVRRVLRLRVHPDGAAALATLPPGERQDLVERRDAELAVVLLRAVGERLHGAQRPDLLEREVGDEPLVRDRRAVHDPVAPALGELVLDVRRGADVRLVAGDEVAVLGGDEVRLDVVGAELDGALVALERVVGQVARGAAMAGHERELVAGVAVAVAAARMRQGGWDEAQRADGGERDRPAHGSHFGFPFR